MSCDICLVVPSAPEAIIVANAVQTMGVAVLAATCERAGYTACIVDAYLERLPPRETAERVAREAPRLVVGFYVPDESTLQHALRTIAHLGESSALWVLGGPFATLARREILARFPYIAAIMTGEADVALPELLRRIDGGERWWEGPNLACSRGGQYHETPMLPMLRDLDSTALPRRADTLDVLRRRGGAASVVTSRGCYARCSYCQVQTFWGQGDGPRWRAMSPARVVQEVAQARRDVGGSTISFMDDNFFGPGPDAGTRAEEIARLFKLEFPDLSFSIFCRSDNVTRHRSALRALAGAGLRTCFMGIESGQRSTLNVLRKGQKPRDHQLAIRALADLGVDVFAGAILFHPWSTLEDIRRDLDFWEQLLREHPGLRTVIFGSIDVLHGTPMAQQLESAGRLEGDPLRGRRYIRQDEAVGLLEAAWEQHKRGSFIPSYLDRFARAPQSAGHEFSRLQISVLRALLDKIERGAETLDELLGPSPPVSALRPDVEDCMVVKCL